MRKIFRLLAVGLALTGFTFMAAQAQTITISGDGIQTQTISASALQDMRQNVVMAKADDEKVHRYTGVSLASLLDKAGVMLGDSTDEAITNSYIIVTSADSSRAIFALAEIDPLFANRVIILANRQDKKPLPAQNGPFEIIVPGEKAHSRWIKQVNSIQLVVVK